MIRFDALGMTWEADVDYRPPEPASWSEPPVPSEVEIKDLRNAAGVECNWVLESDEVREWLEEAALSVCDAEHRRAGRVSVFDEP